ncbi:MAG: AAA family ATPase [Actinomycetota bacterium]|nr:AAA family ATPase [Actinomycetota bacterium]
MLDDVERHIGHGRHILVHGNVHDLVATDPGESRTRWLPFQHALSGTLRDRGYALVATLRVNDGFVFRSHGERLAFEAARDGDARAGEPPPAESDDDEDAMQAAFAMAPDPPRPAMPRIAIADTLEAVSTVRAVLANTVVRVAIVIWEANLLIPAEDEDPGARAAHDQLRAALDEAAFAEPEQPVPLRNACIMVASSPSSGLEGLARGLPGVATVAAPLPGDAERRALLTWLAPRFYAGDVPSAEDVQVHVDRMTRTTDGMTLWDIEAMRRESHLGRIPIADPALLVQRFRRGRDPDGWEDVTAGAFVGLARLMARDVVGQDHALDQIQRLLITARFGAGFAPDAGRERRPRARLLFAGPTGVGKTETAKALCEQIFGSRDALIQIDCGAYTDPTSVLRLTGANPGYVGYERGGVLTEAVAARPMSLVLFDEIEKADRTIWPVLLSVLEDGRLTDGRGQTVDFRDTVVVLTSNVGADTLKGHVGASPETDDVLEHFRNMVESWMCMPADEEHLGRPEVYGRLRQGIVAFDVLRSDALRGLVEKHLGRMQANAERSHGNELIFDVEDVVAALGARLRADDLAIGARGVIEHLEWLADAPYAEQRAAGVLPDDSAVDCTIDRSGAEPATFTIRSEQP